jgi:hypothetical protein
LRDQLEPRVLWIDVIRINQVDIKEQNHQVSEMGEIYSRSIRVVAWLGQENNWESDSTPAILFLQQLLANPESKCCKPKGSFRPEIDEFYLHWRALRDFCG